MPRGLSLLSRGVAMVEREMGTVSFTLQGQGAPIKGIWTPLGRTEVLEVAGRRVSFSETVEARRTQFSVEPKQGLTVTRADTGQVFRISGDVETDELTYRMVLIGSRQK